MKPDYMFQDVFEKAGINFKIRIGFDMVQFFRQDVSRIEKRDAFGKIVHVRRHVEWVEFGRSPVNFIDFNRMPAPVTEYQKAHSITDDRNHLLCERRINNSRVVYIAHGNIVHALNLDYRLGFCSDRDYEFFHNQQEELHRIGFINPKDPRGGLISSIEGKNPPLVCWSTSKKYEIYLHGSGAYWSG
ncbi:hypothetical protein HY486_04650 [Candidatus Woesearchaeota archaeon]|nr:hypothetical protein [Candidatus Woesearchaeota archaeon]